MINRYTTAGDFHAKLTVTSAEGSTTKTIKVSTLSFTPIVYISTPAPGACVYTVPQDIQFYADTSDSAGPVSVAWDVQLVHNGHFHPYSLPTTPNNPATFTLAEGPDAQGAERYGCVIYVAYVIFLLLTLLQLPCCGARCQRAANRVGCYGVLYGCRLRQQSAYCRNGNYSHHWCVASFYLSSLLYLLTCSAASPYAVIFFDSLPSVDADGDILWIDWDFGDGIHSPEQQVYHTYGTVGTYTVTLSIQDNYGAASTATQTITIT